MFMSLGNLARNPQVGLLFIDFQNQWRLRLNGVATIQQNDPLTAEYPEAQLIVRVTVSEVFGNCPRYVHKMQLVERSRFVPHNACQTPVPDWKRDDWARDVLPPNDPARAPS
jgi:predicted pyridoxine 5'-phosphate oxidase superfamily flavin-nucleotide-binding protein